MLTEKFKIHVPNIEDRELIHKKQLHWSYAFRKLYNNLDLSMDKGYVKEIRDKHFLNAKMYDYVVAEAKTWFKKDKAREEDLTERIERRKDDLESSAPKYRPKINKHINYLQNALKNNTVFGSRKLMIEMSKNPDDKELRKLWRDKRNYMMCIKGEAASRGSRYFDFSELSDGIIYYKPDGKTRIKLEIHIKNKTVQELLNCLEGFSQAKSMPLSVHLSSTEIHITYNDAIIHDTDLDMKKIAMSFKKQGLTAAQKNIEWREVFKNHEEKLLRDKVSNRYCGLDLNPDGIGLVIADKLTDDVNVEPTIIHEEYIDFKDLHTKLGLKSSDKRQIKQNNKRKSEVIESCKHIFKLIEHYKVGHFITEELDFSKNEKDKGNKISNRLINNLWCRTLLNDQFTKRVNKIGVIWNTVNPAYSSFIGNIKYKKFDPVAAATEITRRGMTQYTKGYNIFPEYRLPCSINDLVKEFSLPIKMYDSIKSCDTFKGIYDIFSTAKKSARRKKSEYLDDFLANYLGNNKKSKVRIYSSY